MAVPRTVGLHPFNRELPAFPATSYICPGFETAPNEAKHSSDILRISEEGIAMWAKPPSCATTVAAVPAPRTTFPPKPATNSILCTWVPTGMYFKRILLPGISSVRSLHATSLPCFMPSTAKIYPFLPSWYSTRAKNAFRFGSYSIALTFPETPKCSWPKSTKRYMVRLPPPRWRIVILPCLFLPPVFLIWNKRFFSGSFFERSFSIVLSRHQLNSVSLLEAHHCFSNSECVSHMLSYPLSLCGNVYNINLCNFHSVRFLHRVLYFLLVRSWIHVKNIFSFFLKNTCLFCDTRAYDDSN